MKTERFNAKVCQSVTYGLRAYNHDREPILSESPEIVNPMELPVNYKGKTLSFLISDKDGKTCIYCQ